MSTEVIKEKAQAFLATKVMKDTPSYIREELSGERLVIRYNRSRSWTLEELFVSVLLLLIVFMISIVVGVITYSATELLPVAAIAGVISFIPLFYVDFIWLFTNVEFVVTSETITKTLNYGIFKRVHEVSVLEVVEFNSHEMVLRNGDWKLASKNKTNEYLIVRIAVFFAKHA